ncbi:MAG TPA: hypothetical protein DCP31_04175, partial [Cyanobacteria bacterium UBA8543]|nr:hypothetical protein [Cyanobacteria bacterium UBA8543]
MKYLLLLLLEQRAKSLARRLYPHLPKTGRFLDIGSGTGHNVQEIKQLLDVEFVETDVVDMSVVGNGLVIFDGKKLPFADQEFSYSLMLFVLQYCDNPVELLKESRRVTSKRLILIQSTYAGSFALLILRLREFMTGELAFKFSRTINLIDECQCSLKALNYFTRRE